ncbi:MAG: Holliday junction branch migration protein RuvA [Deltaproteobacteria bacterium]|nr:Holliday junction branch migration protein RuvA [Deltaproteobacteria bacterium]
MIAYMQGPLKYKSADSIIIMAEGVGYELHIPLSTFYALADEGNVVSLHVKTVVREDSIELFGFLSRAEKEAFLLLNSVSKIGPRLSLNILSGINPAELIQAVSQKNVARLTAISGVGAKTAERLILELKEKISQLASLVPLDFPMETPAILDEAGQDVISALLNLGYRQAEAERALSAARTEAGQGADLSGLLRLSLKRLQRT